MNNKSNPIALRMKQELVDRVKKDAKENFRSITGQVEMILTLWYAKETDNAKR